MGMTLAEKILSNKVGGRPVRAGEIIEVDVDVASINEFSIDPILDGFERFNRPVWDSNKVSASVLFFPASSAGSANSIQKMKAFCKKMGIKGFFPYGGAQSQVLVEKGFIRPSEVVVGTDSHTITAGAFGTFATGLGVTDMISVLLTGRLWFKVPASIKFEVYGNLPSMVMAKDIVLKMISIVGVAGANYKAVEYTGETVREMGIDSRMALTNMAVEMGGKVGLIQPDEKTAIFIKGRTDKSFNLLKPDDNAQYEAVIPINASEIEPMVACPHNPGNVKPVLEVKPVALDQAFIGTCSGGRIEDLRQAADILEGRTVHPHVRLIIIPATPEIYKQALNEGLVNIFVNAGAIVEFGNCGPCVGQHMGLLAPGEVCISSGNRNFPGRMGSDKSTIYLASPVTVAASAIEGQIADPRKYI